MGILSASETTEETGKTTWELTGLPFAKETRVHRIDLVFAYFSSYMANSKGNSAPTFVTVSPSPPRCLY